MFYLLLICYPGKRLGGLWGRRRPSPAVPDLKSRKPNRGHSPGKMLYKTWWIHNSYWMPFFYWQDGKDTCAEFLRID